MNKMNTHLRLNKGFTLLELLVAIVIASLSVLGFAYTQTKSLQYAHSSQKHTLASIQASNTIEQIWDSICELQSGTKLLSELPAVDTGFTRTFSPTTFNNELTVTINWNDTRLSDVSNSVSTQVIFPGICP